MTIVRTKTPSGDAIVILPEAEFERLRELAEDAEDARTLTRLLTEGDADLLGEAELDALRAAPTPLAFWRAHRGIEAEALARTAWIDRAVLDAIERGEQTGDIALYRRLAGALAIDVEDIAPNMA